MVKAYIEIEPEEYAILNSKTASLEEKVKVYDKIYSKIFSLLSVLAPYEYIHEESFRRSHIIDDSDLYERK